MLVSVIISAYNSRPYLATALAALAAQTLDHEQIEILVVDDGSTDDTWAFLTSLAAEGENLRIFDQPNSGSASRGRNRGLAEARGRYVFFNDADDYLGEDALRRMTAVADAEGSDVVVGHVHRFGLATEHRPSDTNVLDADLIDDGVWRSLSPHKLFRRTLIERLGVSFPEDQVFGEDQVFVATCLFAAHKVSTLGGYDFYHRLTREDGGNLSLRAPQTLANKKLTSCRMTSLVVANTEPGPRRDALLRRIILRTFDGGLQNIFADASPAERDDFLAATRVDVLPYVSEASLEVATPPARFRLLTARDGTADQLLVLKAVVDRPWRYRLDGQWLCYDLGPELNALIPAAERKVREGLPLAHEIEAVEPTPSGLAVRIRVGPGPVPYDRIDLRARIRGGPWVSVSEAPLGPDGTVVLMVAPPREGGEQRWSFSLRAHSAGALVAHSPLGWPSGGDPIRVTSRKSAVGSGPTRRVLKLYGNAEGHARLFAGPAAPEPA